MKVEELSDNWKQAIADQSKAVETADDNLQRERMLLKLLRAGPQGMNGAGLIASFQSLGKERRHRLMQDLRTSGKAVYQCIAVDGKQTMRNIAVIR